MTAGDSVDPMWRVIAKGSDSSVRDWLDRSLEREEVAAARWMENAAPNSAFSVGRGAAAGRGHDVVAEISVGAADADEAARLARSLFDQALPTVTFTEVAAVPDTKDRVHGYPGHCSFCGKPRNEAGNWLPSPALPSATSAWNWRWRSSGRTHHL